VLDASNEQGREEEDAALDPARFAAAAAADMAAPAPPDSQDGAAEAAA